MVTRDLDQEEFRQFTRFFAWLSGALAILIGGAAVVLRITGDAAAETLAVPLLIAAGVLLVVATLFAWPNALQRPVRQGPATWPDEPAPDADEDKS